MKVLWRRLFPEQQRSWRLDLGLLLLRLWFGGAMLIAHGIGKWSRFDQDPIEFADPIGLGPAVSLFLAAFAESVCAALLVLGLATRLAALPLIITMLVAGMVANWFHELALSYFFAYSVLLLLGPGRWSLDYLLRRRLLPVPPADA